MSWYKIKWQNKYGNELCVIVEEEKLGKMVEAFTAEGIIPKIEQ